MFNLLTGQFVMPPVEVEDSTPPVWYDADTLRSSKSWLSAYYLSGALGYTYGSFADLSGVSVKGGHPKGTAVMLNGLLLNQPQSGQADLSDVSTFLFRRAEIWEGGSTPYSIYGNLNLSYLPDTVGYFEIGSRGTLRAGMKWGNYGGEGGLATTGRDSLLYFEGIWKFRKGFLDFRLSRKRTSGMEGFPQTSGLQHDHRIALKTAWVDLLLLRRTWKDWTGYYMHDNLRLSKDVNLGGFTLGLALEGVRSTNVGDHFRPLLSVGWGRSSLFSYVSSGIWTDGRRIGYSAVAGIRKYKIYVEGFTSNRIPSFDELYWKGAGAEGNPSLKNEKGFGISCGFYHDVLRFDLYARRFYDLIEWMPSGGIWRPENVRGARVWGGEAIFNFKFLRLKYTRLYAYDDEGKRLIYRPRNTYFFVLHPYIKFLTFHFTLLYVDPRFTNSENTRFVDYILLMNGGMSLDLKRAQLYFSVENLTDGKYYFVERYPLVGRTFSLRLEMNRL